VVEGYLKEMGVPPKYADMMFSIPKDEIRWIDSAEFHADFNGDIPELKDWIDARCNKMTDPEKAFSKAVSFGHFIGCLVRHIHCTDAKTMAAPGRPILSKSP
jgi:hypothetical protein